MSGPAGSEFVVLELPDGDAVFHRALFPAADSDRLLRDLTDGICWRQETLKLYGKVIEQPRLTAWYGDPGKGYTYSGISLAPEAWTPDLLEVKTTVEAVAGVAFNSVLLNLYRDGHDSVSWHSDDEPELGTNPVIASVSFGAARKFQLRHKKARALKREVELTHGSLLLMRGGTQHHWVHQIPKTSRPCGPRINLTFRVIV